MSMKQQFIDTYNRETDTTLRVLRAFPEAHADLRPHKMCQTARELAWLFVMEQGMGATAATTGFDWANPAAPPSAPASLAEIIKAFDEGRAKLVSLLNQKDDALSGSVTFPVAPKTMGNMSLGQFLWFLLHDQIHHRGQFSIYLRMADGKVPSIYGPTADEPWM